jgi:hypothetical protein
MSTKELTNIEIISAGLAGVSGNKAAVVTRGRNRIVSCSKIDLFYFLGGAALGQAVHHTVLKMQPKHPILDIPFNFSSFYYSKCGRRIQSYTFMKVIYLFVCHFTYLTVFVSMREKFGSRS